MKRRWLAAVLLASLLSHGLASTPSSLGARNAGQGGAIAAQAGGTEALYGNPAALRSLSDLQWGVHGGLGGTAEEWQGAAALAMPLTYSASWGLSLDHAGLRQGGTFREDRLALALSLPLNDWAWAGLRPALGNSSYGGLGAWSLDAGLQASVGHALGWTQGWDLGLWLKNLASSTGSAYGDEMLPVEVALAQNWSPWNTCHLSAQLDLVDRADSGMQTRGRFGLEESFWDEALSLRAGSILGTDAQPQVTGGWGTKLKAAGRAWSLDYALQVPTDSAAVSTLRHLISLNVGFLPTPTPIAAESLSAPAATLSFLGQDASTGIINKATLNIEAMKDPLAEAWELALINDKGSVVRTFQGKGTLPASLEWDGKGNDGALVNSSSVSYSLRIKRSNGRELVRRSVLFGQQSLMEELGTLIAADPLLGHRPRLPVDSDGPMRLLASGLENCDINRDMTVCACRFSFVLGSVAIDEEDLVNFWHFLDLAKRAGYTDWSLHGHADATGSADFNQRLSERRDDEVLRRILTAGMKPDKLEMIGFGSRRPVASNDTEEERRLNRRVEITARRPRQKEAALVP